MSTDLSGRVAVVTGAAGGMGRVIATELARAGATVVALTRTATSGDELVREMLAGTDSRRVQIVVADLAVQADVRRAAAEVAAHHQAVHLLVNNAGAHYRHHQISPDGIEMNLAVNHLAGFLLTEQLLPQLRAGSPSRVINVVSAAMADTRQIKLRRRPRPVTLEATDLLAPQRLSAEQGYDPFTAYARAKLLTLMCGYVLAERLRADRVTVNAVHPGLVATGLIGDVAPAAFRPFLGLLQSALLTPEQGAASPLHLAVDPQLQQVTGAYYERTCPRRSPPISYHRDLQQLAWAASQTLTGPQPSPSDMGPSKP
ncbi:SDR family NAD(P)-dependent oxidoreductase [Paenarthrobacter sp. PH39-S1]|uniref:SDR family NAD(P)-dependent oxidoreductase n=1 Tax=Paenarthrobacter sp. PH39-S1 TaxID=3046204 RepID=UPI0024B97018|nr:SDR family NAD(P)-dependent oxidoreductase [Paenarthrobacter sp. PH39-S1]MDJ0358422.1 SDR family NAD(P)-dependent oxidoreductase [Paenarthrobacter sp. PH39-S1]